jgi:RimJ/RimL family protein N-acetyltransferase
MMEVKPVTLEGRVVRLEPLNEKHLPDLFEAAQDDEIWLYMPIARPQTLADVQKWYEATIKGQRDGIFLPFAIIDKATGRAIGSTRYLAIAPQDYSVEIGWTWLNPNYWRSPINTECKYLLLRHAFEELHCIRVWFKTDSRNIRSQNAITRLGAQKEGVLRKHVIVPKDGYQRHSVVFSIIDDEWPQVKAGLEAKMGLTIS